MKVIHINTKEQKGGASIAAYRLHEGLLATQIESKLLVGSAQTNNPLVEEMPSQSYLEKRLLFLAKKFGLNYINLFGTFKIRKNASFLWADVVNFHNLHGDYFNYLALANLTKVRPGVLTLHDMWLFTGHCSYSFGCERWLNGCGCCPNLWSYPPVSRDSTKIEWRLKKNVYDRSNLTVVAPSKWMAYMASKSILSSFDIHHIPYGIDTNIYKPLGKQASRDVIGIPLSRHVLLFSCESLKDLRKGGDIVVEAIRRLPQSILANSVLLTFGSPNYSLPAEVPIPVINLGYIGGDSLKAVAYSAADLFIFPTRADNLPLVLLESMACGTPMISTNVGGVNDIVRNEITGLIASADDSADFSSKITHFFESKPIRKQLAENCRRIAESEYTIQLQAKRYSNLYSQVLEKTYSNSRKKSSGMAR